LDNLLQRALILKNGSTIELSELAFQADATMPSEAVSEEPEPANLQQSLQSVEEQKILDALAAGSRKLAAEQLGISPRTLRYKLARMRDSGISIPR
jgi:two-component system response regulator FlrC